MFELETISPEAAKAILLAICDNDPYTHNRALSMLFISSKQDTATPPSTPQKQGTKRKAESDFLKCGKCQEPYYEEDNSEKACWYHTGQ